MPRRAVDRPLLRWGAIAGDLLAAYLTLVAARAVRRHFPIPFTTSLLPEKNFRFTEFTILLTLAVQLLTLSLFGFYTARIRLSRGIGRLLVPAQAAQLLIFTALFFFTQYFYFPRTVLILYLLFDGVLLWVFRTLLHRATLASTRGRLLIVGGREQGRLLAEAITRHAWTGISLAAIAVTNPEGPGDTPAGYAVRTPEELAAVIEKTGSDFVLFAPEKASFRDLSIEHMALSGTASLWVLPSPYETLIGRLHLRPLGELPLLEVRTSAPQGAAAWAKRGLDIVVAAAGLVLFSPLLAFSAAAIGLFSGRPVFFRQERVGRGGRTFLLRKFRTMQQDAEAQSGAVLASRDDPRVTRIGRFLRATRIDEIPQLWNVLKGEMSLVGPRPERPEFAGKFEKEIPGYSLRLAVRPGLTGLAQISGEYETHAEIKLRYDLTYINSWSLGFDLLILLRTLPVVLTRRGI